ncbi:hypothetical protein XI03_11295 [Bradyrhizobium sp. CCBAU 65884]|uniref:recombinase family protein n=1 Tax=Bradyrhizobium sp. CCBAU 65884 TaxID=722477 RepID=UPI00230575DC|nr:recombinase family protein [Bradyrhizobium sp. CCBAU 65884]MDA9475073.1 hypothetical protein [Bradyrhizobium sp. CCBAU 65884]
MDISDAYKQRYVIYNRKSTDDAENQRNSLTYQRQRNIEFATRQNLPLATALTIQGFCTNGIIDESHSGFKEEDEFEIRSDGRVQYRVLRPKFLKLAELLKNGTIRGAIFLCWDRASRNPHDDLIIKKLTRAGCDIRFAEASYDSTSAGELHRDIDGVFAAHYSRSISEKVKNAQKKLRAERRCIYSAPVGYLDRGSDSKPLDPERAPVVKRIFELYAGGDWSIRQLAKWAQTQGLTKKPIRRKRTKQEIANNVDVSSLPKISRPVDHKSIEYILANPFYIGKVKIGDNYEISAAHQPLIDTALFFRVQKLLKKRNVSVHYIDKLAYTYRELVRCECGRVYTPYVKKGIVYYRSRCKSGCTNKAPNLKEVEISAAVQRVMDEIYLSDEELSEIELRAKSELGELSRRREGTLNDLHGRQRCIIADLDYITENKISLLRTGAMNPDTILAEQNRLEAKLAVVNEEIKIYAESASDMLEFVLTFSEAVKNAGLYFDRALDSEKRDITAMIFSELVFKDRQLVAYQAKDGFGALLSRVSVFNGDLPSLEGVINHPKLAIGLPGSPLFRTIESVYVQAQKSMDRIRRLQFLHRQAA